MTPCSDKRPTRLSTGIAGFDSVLQGGLLPGAIYVVQGAPGAGKTILANQMCATVVAKGGSALYVTLLSELTSGIVAHMRSFSFFSETGLGERLQYLSATKAAEENGLHGIIDFLTRELQHRHVDLIVLDSLPAIDPGLDGARDDYRSRMSRLLPWVQMTGATTVLLSPRPAHADGGPVQQMADGVIELREAAIGVRRHRRLEVVKFRGSGYLPGPHAFTITEAGITVYPRIEAQFATPSGHTNLGGTERITTGVPTLDQMMNGGIPVRTTVLVAGSPGTGKTTLGMQFVGRATPEEPAVWFGFYETPERLRDNGRALGVDVEALERSGALEIVWQPQAEHDIDELAYRLLDAVTRRRARRVFLDGVDGFLVAATEPERTHRFLPVLATELVGRGATVMSTLDKLELSGFDVRSPIRGPSALTEGIVLLRFVEHRNQLVRLASVTKVRSSRFDHRVRRFEITNRGIEIGDAWTG